MEETDYLAVNIELLSAARLLCPGQHDQEIISRQINHIRWQESDHNKERMVTDYLLATMTDGIRFGNWPHVIEKLGKKK
jgi:hypothetical protein